MTTKDAAAGTRSDLGAMSGIGMTIALVGAGAAVTVPGKPVNLQGFHAGATIYPWWVWAILAVGIVTSLVSINTGWENAALAPFSSGAALVSSGVLVGIGVVGRVHIKPAFGMGGGYGNLSHLQLGAMLLALCGLVAAGLAILQLVVRRQLPVEVPGSVRLICVFIGAALIALLPLAVAFLDPDARDLTSWGAIGLIYAGPWGASLVLSAWLVRPAALGVLTAVAVAMLAAATGPQMTDLIFQESRGIFALCLAAPLVAIAVRVQASGRQERVDA